MSDSRESHHRRAALLTRREMLGLSAAGAMAVPLQALLSAASASARQTERPYLDAALKAGRWMSRSTTRDPQGARWPADPAKPTSVSFDLYNGTPGVIPFWLELHHATGDPSALRIAEAGGDFLAGSLDDVSDAGLYTGLAGVATVLQLVAEGGGSGRHADAARRALQKVRAAARLEGTGVVFNDFTDIISGSAGVGLFLLWAHARLQDEGSLDLAAQAGRRLIELGEPDHDGLKWHASSKLPRNYPNFSHGTAGVAYFLAALHAATGEQAFLGAAEAGARYLSAIATHTASDGRMVFHSEPGNEQLFYLSWCHGPAGTARLFHQLGVSTGQPAYRTWVNQLTTAIVDMKVPERSAGFWNNVSQCCGNCGVTEFFLSRHRQTGDAGQLAFARAVAENTLRRATADGDGLKWIQAENRIQPDSLIAQTGLMQGAAGVGIALLHLDGATVGRAPFFALPDNPWR
jgi:lantibiotic modifying enzyme